MTNRYVCHQCGKSFELPPNSQDYTCPHCSSEFIEQLEPFRHRSRAALNDNLTASDQDEHGNDEMEEAEEEEDEEEIGRGNASGRFEIRTFPGGILFRGSTIPFPFAPPFATLTSERQPSFTDMIRFVVDPGSFSPEHPIWQAVGFQGDPADYVFSESAFQAALSSLMDQGGMRCVGLNETQLDELERKIISKDDDDGDAKNKAGKTCAICQEPYQIGEETIILACGHQFHADCICPWLSKVASCPICRHDPLSKKPTITIPTTEQ